VPKPFEGPAPDHLDLRQDWIERIAPGKSQGRGSSVGFDQLVHSWKSNPSGFSLDLFSIHSPNSETEHCSIRPVLPDKNIDLGLDEGRYRCGICNEREI
jgi:hypothetical protein